LSEIALGWWYWLDRCLIDIGKSGPDTIQQPVNLIASEFTANSERWLILPVQAFQLIAQRKQ